MKSRFLRPLSDKVGTVLGAVATSILPCFAALMVLAGPALAAAGEQPLAAAIALYQARRYPEAEAALRPIAAAEPADAVACHYLGLAVLRQGGPTAHADALPWLKKAADLEPGNARYAAAYGDACLELARERRSFSMALAGRDAMERAVKLDPDDLDTRASLVKLYIQAPWPIGSSAKARAQAAEIGRRDAVRGAKAWVYLGRYCDKHGDRAAAREAFQSALALHPGDPPAKAGLDALAAGQP